MLELLIVLILPLAMAVFGIGLIVNAMESIKKSLDEWKK